MEKGGKQKQPFTTDSPQTQTFLTYILQTPDGYSMEELLDADSAGLSTLTDPYTTGDTGPSFTMDVRDTGSSTAAAGPYPDGLAGAAIFGPGPLAAAGMEEALHSGTGSAPPDFGMREGSAVLSSTATAVQQILPVEGVGRSGLVVDTGLVQPYPYSTAADMGLPQPQPGGHGMKEAPVGGSSKRKGDALTSTRRGSSTLGFNLVESEAGAGLAQPDPDFVDKPPDGSTDEEIIRFLRNINMSGKYCSEVNSSLAVQDQVRPRTVRSYVTRVRMMAGAQAQETLTNLLLGLAGCSWREKDREIVRAPFQQSDGPVWQFGRITGVKATFQFHKNDGTKTNWFMQEYIPTSFWGIDLYFEGLCFRKVFCTEEPADKPVRNRINKRTPPPRMRGPNSMVVGRESPSWQHFIKIYDRRPDLEGCKVLYAVCCKCDGVLQADSKNGTNSLSTHCDRTCPSLKQHGSQA